jgi:hypothetical protein
MRTIVFSLLASVCAVSPAVAVEFLGVDLCEGSVDTAVVLPVGSPLSLQSAEIGRYGGLLLLLTAENGDILDHIDNLMSSYTGSRGTGDAKKLQWTGNQLTAYAQLIKNGSAALAVSTTDTCSGVGAAATEVPGGDIEPVAPETATPPPPSTAAAPAAKNEAQAVEAAAVAVAAATAAVQRVDSTNGPGAPVAAAVSPEEPAPPAAFRLKGKLKHAAAEDGWVDVMGVVVNDSGQTYAVASFDLSLYDGSGDLICVDTISVNQLRDGQERAFRSAIRCPDYDAAAVASWKLQFAGAH